MKLTWKKRGAWTFGAAGIMAASCAACCISVPILGPLLAWLGVAGLGAAATGWYVAVASAFALGIGVFFIVRHRRRRGHRAAQSERTCDCSTSCTI